MTHLLAATPMDPTLVGRDGRVILLRENGPWQLFEPRVGRHLCALCIALLCAAGCGQTTSPATPTPSVPPASNPLDKPLGAAGAVLGKFIGTAVQANLLGNGSYRSVVEREFGALTAEYEMKWNVIEPSRGDRTFTRGDTIVTFGTARGMVIKGHALLWHQSTPAWAEGLPADELRAAVALHVRETMQRYQGRVRAWDVVNEAIADDGSGLRNTVFRRQLGDNYVAEVFRWARAADPGALLFYNDYGAAGLSTKSNQVYDLVRDLKSQGLVDGVGLQMHISAGSRPSDANIAANMRRLADLGLLVNLSEMDVKINGVPGSDAARLEAQRNTYRDVVRLCVAEPRCDGVTFWGFTDAYTWLSGDRPLLFDAAYQPKPAYHGVLDALFGR